MEYASQEPLLLLACSLKGFSLAHTAADAGSTSTLQLLIELMHQHAQDLSARLQEVLDWGSNGAEVLKNLRWVGQKFDNCSCCVCKTQTSATTAQKHIHTQNMTVQRQRQQKMADDGGCVPGAVTLRSRHTRPN